MGDFSHSLKKCQKVLLDSNCTPQRDREGDWDRAVSTPEARVASAKLPAGHCAGSLTFQPLRVVTFQGCWKGSVRHLEAKVAEKSGQRGPPPCSRGLAVGRGDCTGEPAGSAPSPPPRLFCVRV